MKMSNHADALREALVRSAGLGDERARRIAGDLADAAGPALQLQTLAIAADLAAEVNRLTDAVHVDVIVTESGADLRVTPLEAEAPGPAAPPPLEPSPPQAGGEETARVTLRIPEGLKRRIDGRARAAGVSLNSWILRAILLASHDGPPRGGPARRPGSTGLGDSLRGWAS